MAPFPPSFACLFFLSPLAELTCWCSFACYMPTHTIIPVFAPYAALALSVQNLAMRPKKVPPLLFTSDTEGKKKCSDFVLDGRQGSEFTECGRQLLPAHMVKSQSCSYSSVVLGDSKHFCQCRAEPGGDRTGWDTTFCVLPLPKHRNIKFIWKWQAPSIHMLWA